MRVSRVLNVGIAASPRSSWRGWRFKDTYTTKKCWHGRDDDGGKCHADDHGRVLGRLIVLMENVLALAVAQRGLVGERRGVVGCQKDLEVEESGVEGLGAAEGPDNNVRGERSRSDAQLNGKVFLGLLGAKRITRLANNSKFPLGPEHRTRVSGTGKEQIV